MLDRYILLLLLALVARAACQLTLNCTGIQLALAEAGARLTECMGRSARPFTLCADCYQLHHRYQELHRQLSADRSGSGFPAGDAANCRKYLMQLDSVQVLARTRDFVDSVWSSSRCKDCFAGDQPQNGTAGGPPEYRPELKKFFAKTKLLWRCFANYSRFPLPQNSSLPPNQTEQICVKCSDLYTDLNSEFLLLSGKHGSSSAQRLLCMDAVDAINSTHRLWSESYRCDVRNRSLQPLPLILAAYLTATLFYVGARSQGEIKKRKLLKQKRLSSLISSVSINSASTAPSGDI